MRSRQYPLVFLVTALLLALMERVGVAFTIKFQPDGTYIPVVPYRLSDGRIGEVQTALMLSIDRSLAVETRDKLKAAFPGWAFNIADKDLAGSFDISGYYADLRNGSGVGANLRLHYAPATIYNPSINYNPTPAGSELHWIQRLISNHSSEGHGYNEDHIDVPSGQANPFYDLIPGLTMTDEDDFADGPARFDSQENHTWSAELYLVEKSSGKQEVTIYNGIEWGWRNIVTLPPPVSVPPCGGGSGGGGCLTTARAFKYESPTSVPEPAAGLGLLALGTWGAVQGLKIRKSKQQ